MAQLPLNLDEAIKELIESRLSTGAFSDASDYISRLVRDDCKRRKRDEIDAALLEALNAAEASPLTSTDWDDIRQEGRAMADIRKQPPQ